MDFKIIWQSYCPEGGEVPFETFFFSGRLKVKVTLEGQIMKKGIN